MFNMLERPPFIESSYSPVEKDPYSPVEKATVAERGPHSGRWRGVLAVGSLFAVAAFIIAAPLADREIVPRSFMDQLNAAFDSDMPGGDQTFEAPITTGEPVMSIPPTSCETALDC